LFSQYAPPNAVSGTYTLLSNSPAGGTDYSNSSVYQASSGAWVFAAGTLQWTYALDNYNGSNIVDPRIQKTTANILNRFVTPLTDFTIAAAPSSQTVTQGGSTSYGVTVNPTGGFSGQVTLGVSGLPSGANGSFTPNPATASSTLSVTTSTSTPAGTYTLTLTGVSGSLTHTTTVALVVSAPGDFTLSASPSTRPVTAGGSTSFSLAINPVGGFSGQVTLSVSGLPGGASGSFTPNPAIVSSTLPVTTSTSTPAGSYTLTITGSSGGLTHNTVANLRVR
jgi:serine protease AprX